jgi:hypothetical protein
MSIYVYIYIYIYIYAYCIYVYIYIYIHTLYTYILHICIYVHKNEGDVKNDMDYKDEINMQKSRFISLIKQLKVYIYNV